MMNGWNVLILILFVIALRLVYVFYKSMEDKVIDDYQQTRRRYPKPEQHGTVVKFLMGKYAIALIAIVVVAAFLFGMISDMVGQWRYDHEMSEAATSAPAGPCHFTIPTVPGSTTLSVGTAGCISATKIPAGVAIDYRVVTGKVRFYENGKLIKLTNYKTGKEVSSASVGDGDLDARASEWQLTIRSATGGSRVILDFS